MADLRKEELFPADAFGLFYLQITRIPGGWHRHAEYEIFYHISGSTRYVICWDGEPCRTRLICCAASKIYANFYRAFRGAYGQSPREYARTHRIAAEEPTAPDA